MRGVRLSRSRLSVFGGLKNVKQESKQSQIHMDSSFHYPPELLELLCDAVPALFRSKQGVIDFFVGAGVPLTYLGDWKTKLEQDRDSVKKHEIARSILCRLNEAGDAALAMRREVVKRVSEFDDFNSCWDSDRYKAQGLVAQIQKLVNVKDSFTRINLEREKERKGRQAVYAASVLAKQKDAQAREAIRASLYKLFSETDPHKRGKQPECVLNNLFSYAGFLVREAFTRTGVNGEGIIEQIDGAVEIDGVLYLVEMKWWDKPIGRQEIAPHFVSVYGRGDVSGIFISYSGFTPAAIDDAKTGLAQKVFVLAELQEIVQVMDREGDLKAFFKEKIHRAKTDRNPFYKLPS
ncbi:MAG TPA: restriction endonuclease [Terriglobia bacterium]|nr:restriction endonuclease [Terriglobia bacterium]